MRDRGDSRGLHPSHFLASSVSTPSFSCLFFFIALMVQVVSLCVSGN